jgi:hypothetical protein
MIDVEKSDASFYHLLWRSSDMEIERADLPRWRQSDFAAASPGFVTLRSHEANASSFSLAASRELMRRREEVATRIWDQRILTTVTQAYAYVRRRSKAIGRADAAMNSLGTGVMTLNPTDAETRSTAAADRAGAARPAAAPRAPIEFRYGYLLFADTAFVALRQRNEFNLTLRRMRMLAGNFSGASLADAPTFVSLERPLGLGLPTPTVTYAIHSPAFDLSIAHNVSPSTDVSLSGSHDFVQRSDRLYFSVAYRF